MIFVEGRLLLRTAFLIMHARPNLYTLRTNSLLRPILVHTSSIAHPIKGLDERCIKYRQAMTQTRSCVLGKTGSIVCFRQAD